MNVYEFTLKFAVPTGMERETLEDRLFEVGCDDALIGSGQPGRLALTFDRSAANALLALHSALCDVRKAVPEARLIEAEPDFVGVSDIADIFSFSRQNMRKLVQTHLESFPLPLHEGRSSLWHLAEVLDWFEGRQERTVNPMLREVARASLAVNMARESALVGERDEADGRPRLEVG